MLSAAAQRACCPKHPLPDRRLRPRLVKLTNLWPALGLGLAMLGAIAVDNLSRSSRWQVLGNHCYEHVAMVLERPWSYGSEIARTDALIRALGCRGLIRFRPPYGRKLLVLPWLLARQRRLDVLWDGNPRDGTVNDPAEISKRVLALVRPATAAPGRGERWRLTSPASQPSCRSVAVPTLTGCLKPLSPGFGSPAACC